MNLSNGQFDHLLGGRGLGKEVGSDLVHLGIGISGRKNDRNEQGIRVFVVKRDLWMREEVVEDLLDEAGFFQ